MDASTLTRALPESFAFYHLGDVRLGPTDSSQAPIRPEELDELQAVAFNFKNDLNGILLVLFEKGLDASTYAEAGNIIASRLATRLAEDQGLDVMITPPRHLSAPQLATILLSGQPMIHRTYHHFAGGVIVPLQTMLIPIPSEGLGYA